MLQRFIYKHEQLLEGQCIYILIMSTFNLGNSVKHNTLSIDNLGYLVQLHG